MGVLPNDASVTQLVGMIYEAAEDPSRWATFLKAFGELFRAHIIQLELIGPELSVIESVGMPERDMLDFRSHYINVNPWVGLISAAAVGDAAPSHAVVPDSAYRKTEYFNDFAKRIEQYYGMAGVIFKSPSEVGVLGALRDRQTGPCTDQDVQCLQMLIPHLARALRIGSQLGRLKAEAGVLLDCLDRLARGIVILDSRGCVVRANKAAEAMAAQRDGIHLSTAAGLRAHLSHESAALQKMIREAAATSLDGNGSAGGTLTISRPSLRRPWIAIVSPFRVSAREGLAAVLLIDPEEKRKPPAELVSRLFGFTRAETKLALLLANGTRLEDAAAELRVTINTARTHTRRMLEKAGLRRQTDLVLLLNKLPSEHPT